MKASNSACSQKKSKRFATLVQVDDLPGLLSNLSQCLSWPVFYVSRFYIILSASQNNSTYSWSCFSLSFLPPHYRSCQMWVREPRPARERQWLLRPEEMWLLAQNHLAAEQSYCSLNHKVNPWMKNNKYFLVIQEVFSWSFSHLGWDHALLEILIFLSRQQNKVVALLCSSSLTLLSFSPQKRWFQTNFFSLLLGCCEGTPKRQGWVSFFFEK